MTAAAYAATLLHDPGAFAEDAGVLVRGGAPGREAALAMLLMGSPVVARIYEALWRPALVRLFSSVTYALEDELMDRHLGSRRRLRILDLCCGTARASRRWVARDGELLGIDISRAMLREARRRCTDERLVLVEGDARAVVARAGTFDAAVCFAALHLLPCPEAVLDRACEAVRSGGFFIGWVAVSEGLMRVPPVRAVMARTGLRLFAAGALAKAVSAHGFEVVETAISGAVELVVARRPADRQCHVDHSPGRGSAA